MTKAQESLLFRHLPLTTEAVSVQGELHDRNGLPFASVRARCTTDDEDDARAEAVAEIVNAWRLQREMLRVALELLVQHGSWTTCYDGVTIMVDAAARRRLSIPARAVDADPTPANPPPPCCPESRESGGTAV